MSYTFGKRLSALGLVAFGIVVHVGCDAPKCPPGLIGPYDNRDRHRFPSRDQDWVCVIPPEPVTPSPPPSPPDLGEYKQADLPGPRDPDAVAKAAVFLESCIHEALSSDLNINSRIDTTYSAVRKSALERRISERVSCFKKKTNGCQAVQECLGIAIVPHDPTFATSCTNGVALRRIGTEPDAVRDLWIHCENLGDLHCYSLPEPWCGAGRGECTEPATCKMFPGNPINCRYSEVENKVIGYWEIRCLEYGLVCNDDGPDALCVGAGATCSPLFSPAGENFVDFRAGLACNDETNLTACINGHETSVDCSKLGDGFKCIGGSRPHCAADFQCNYDGSNPLPTCDGTSINICNAGVRTTFDCTSLGFDGCDAERGVCKPKPIDAQK